MGDAALASEADDEMLHGDALLLGVQQRLRHLGALGPRGR
jgi:hypothetical protein